VTRRGRFEAVVVLALAVAALGVEDAMAVEEAEYAVVESHGSIELRRYAPMVVAETEVAATFEDAGGVAFRRLFRYISGDNRARREIAMTAPVVQEDASQKIAMTAPVVQEGEGSSWRIGFVLPAAFRLASAPEPTDPAVRLRAIPERTVAAIRFSGTWGEDRFAQHEAELRAWLAERGLEPVGKAVYARYNAPFVPWFLRRNEVLVPLGTTPAD